MQKRYIQKPITGNIKWYFSVCPEKYLIQLINSTKEISAHKVLLMCLQIMAQACQALCEDQLCEGQWCTRDLFSKRTWILVQICSYLLKCGCGWLNKRLRSLKNECWWEEPCVLCGYTVYGSMVCPSDTVLPGFSSYRPCIILFIVWGNCCCFLFQDYHFISNLYCNFL